MNRNIIIALSVLFLASCGLKISQNQKQDEVSAQETVLTEEALTKPFTSSHVFTAEFEGVHFHTCMGLTSLCPEECGSSGNMATFKVLDYQAFVVNGQGGTEKLDSYHLLISDYYKKELDEPYVPFINTLEPGDIVNIHLEYVYDTTQSTVRTVENLVSIKKKVIDAHGSQLALDWDGIYKGIILNAEGDSLQMTITLFADGTFIKIETLVRDSAESCTENGQFVWDASGSNITLIGSATNQHYKVGENILFLLPDNFENQSLSIEDLKERMVKME